MLDNRVEERYRKLEKPVKRSLKYGRQAGWSGWSIIIVFSIWVLSVVGLTLISGEQIPKQISVTSTFLVVAYTWAALLVFALLIRKARLYRPNADDLMLYYVCSILESLEDYRKSKIPALREEHRRKAVKGGKELLSTVIEDWTLGDFGLAKQIFESTVSDISDNLSNRVAPSLEKGDEETLKKVEHALYQFAQYLLDPSLEKLQHVNKSMSDNLDSYETAKLGFVARFSPFFATHVNLKHGIMVVLIFTFSFVSTLVGIHYLRVSADTSFLGFATIFSALVVGYFTYVSKK